MKVYLKLYVAHIASQHMATVFEPLLFSSVYKGRVQEAIQIVHQTSEVRPCGQSGLPAERAPGYPTFGISYCWCIESRVTKCPVGKIINKPPDYQNVDTCALQYFL